MGEIDANEKVVIVGAGMVGLATAWFLQERGVDVTVVDRDGVAAGASWGNAGFLTPTLTLPLPEPAMLKAGVTGILKRSSPASISPRLDASLLKFLTGFAMHSTWTRWKAAMRVFNEVNPHALAAYDQLADTVDEPTKRADPFLAVFPSSQARGEMAAELERSAETGAEVECDMLDGDEVRHLEPILSEDVHSAIRIEGQRFINPPAFVHSLADAVKSRGGAIVDGFAVEDIADLGSDGVELRADDGRTVRAGRAVIANGAWLEELARPFGVRTPVVAGRGYSFSVWPEQMPTHPIYLPAAKSACNPLGDRFRVTGMMEFAPPDASPRKGRIDTLAGSVEHMFTGIDWSKRDDEWVGPRPCTPDGLPLIGRSGSPNVYIAGGHGMWGVALGPLTGRLVADQMTGTESPVLRHFDPLR